LSDSASKGLTVSWRKLRPDKWPLGRGVLIACMGLCGVALPPSAVIAQATNLQTGNTSVKAIDPDDERFIALGLARYRLADDITSATLNGSQCVDFQQVLTALDFPIIVDSARRAASGWFVRENQTFTLDLATGVAQIGGQRTTISTNDIGRLSTGACLTTDALTKLLGVSFVYDPRGALLTATTAQPLPILQRLQRQTRTPAGSLRAGSGDVTARVRSLPYRMFVPPNTDVAISYSVHRAKETQRQNTLAWSVLSIGELAYMTAELQLSGTQAGLLGDVSRFRLYRAEREGGVFGQSKLTEVSIGDIGAYGSSLGSIGGVGLGFSASTFPLNRPTSFDRTNFEGDLPAGWDVELYRNGQLLEFSNDGVSGGYSFKDVPILFGDNNFEIVQYGPQGQRRVINRRINATTFLAPKGAAYYRAAIYRPEVTFGRRRPDSGLRVDLRSAFGISENLNVGAGLDSYVFNGKWLSVGTLSLLTSVSGIALNTEIAATSEGKFAGQLEFQGNGKGSGLRGRLVVAQEGFKTERFGNNLMARLETSADRSMIFSNSTSGTLAGRVQIDKYYTGETLFSARERFTLSRGNAWLAQSLTWSHTSSGRRRDQIDGDFAFSLRHGSLGFRTSADYSLYPDIKLNRLSAIVERSFSVDPKAWRWRAETNWNANEKNFSYTFAAGRNFNAMNVDLFAETNGKDAHRVGVSVSFSLGRRSQGWGVTYKPLAGSGTVRARLFEDMDDNGQFSDGDIPVSGASVLSQNSTTPSTTNAQGYAVIDSVPPNERAQINVLTDELIDSNLFARPTYTKPREGTVSEIAIPLTQMGSVEGTVTMTSGVAGTAKPLGGVSLVLLDARRREIARTTTAYDGFYSFDLVPVGNYSVELAPDTSLATRLRPVTPLTVVTTRDDPGARDASMNLIETNPTITRMALRGLM
jgi:hypothetical protein